MSQRTIVFLAVVSFVMVTSGVAHAQYNVPSQATGQSRPLTIADDGGAEIAQPAAEAKLAIGWELGASLDFMTSDPSLAGRKLKFTDVVLFRLHGLVALGKRVELFAGVDLLPKQPSYTDELIWQGALIGTRFQLNQTLSTYVRSQGGPILDRDGHWIAGEAALLSKVNLVGRELFWDSGIGGTYTQLFLDEPLRKRFWQTELLAQTGLGLRDKKGQFATWLTFGFHFPLVARPKPSNPDPSGRALDPQVRVGVSIGTLLGVTKSLDLFIEWSILDRGDFDDPTTTLPILSGGFDQKRLLFGFNKRFGERRR